MKHATLIFPNQLFEHHPAITHDRIIILIEHPRFFTDFQFHKQKILLHRASMRAYYDTLLKQDYSCIYLEFNEADALFDILQKKKIREIHCIDFCDHTLEYKIKTESKKAQIQLNIYESPMFMTPRDFIKKKLAGKKHLFMHTFYIDQRKRLNVMMHKGKPMGGSWSFDNQNRKPLTSHTKIPSMPKEIKGKYIQDGIEYVNRHFKKNPGELEKFYFPITHLQAKSLVDEFLEKRFAHFGDFQDAIAQNEPLLFHSFLSSALNIGLVTPEYVLNKALEYAKKHKIQMNNVEGFVRQIIGWREFVRAVYLMKGKKQSRGNFFKHSRTLPLSFWSASTGIKPIDCIISRVLKYAYAHHIERLMVLGNFMMLAQIKPPDVYTWFMELFIDAYDWVMVPNVFGMSQYADGGFMTTKPYVSSSNYLLKMSDFQKGDWCAIWDALYWHFLHTNRTTLAKIHRAKIMILPLRKMSPAALEKKLSVAKDFLATLNRKSEK